MRSIAEREGWLTQLRQKRTITEDTQTPQDQEGLDKDDIRILTFLRKSSPGRCSLYDIEAKTRLTRKTIGKRLNALITRRLADRPLGPRKGVLITPAGIEVLGRRKPK
jgi:RIO-like serine/threonine protein kinase